MNLSQSLIDRIACAVVDELERRGYVRKSAAKTVPPGWEETDDEEDETDVQRSVREMIDKMRRPKPPWRLAELDEDRAYTAEAGKLRYQLRKAVTIDDVARLRAAIDAHKAIRKAKMKERRAANRLREGMR